MPTTRCDSATTNQAYAHGAEIYDDAWSPLILGPAESVVRELDLTDARRLLDVGAGTGALAPALRAHAPRATVISVEPAWAMLRFAHARRGVIGAMADALALPVQTGTMNAVLLAYVLFMLTDPRQGLREAVRVLRASGRVGTVTWAYEDPPVAARTWDRTLDELGVPTLPPHSNHSGLDTPDHVAALLESVGLEVGRVWQETVMHTFQPDAFWKLRTGHGTNRLRLAGIGEERRAQALKELRSSLASLTPADYEFRGRLVCAVSQKPTG